MSPRLPSRPWAVRTLGGVGFAGIGTAAVSPWFVGQGTWSDAALGAVCALAAWWHAGWVRCVLHGDVLVVRNELWRHRVRVPDVVSVDVRAVADSRPFDVPALVLRDGSSRSLDAYVCLTRAGAAGKAAGVARALGVPGPPPGGPA